MGLQTLADIFSTLGLGKDERLNELWKLLDTYENVDGKMILEKTLTKSYLPKEKCELPSKRVTFYTLRTYKNKL